MSKSSRHDIDKDQRQLVLLALGLLIVLAHFFNYKIALFFCFDSAQKLHVQSLSWQEDGFRSRGFYLQTSPMQLPEKEISPAPCYHPSLAPFFFLPIPINSSNEELLITIPGVGPTLARRIIDFRQQFGAVQNEEDLLRIKGIGPAKLKEIMRAIDFK